MKKSILFLGAACLMLGATQCTNKAAQEESGLTASGLNPAAFKAEYKGDSTALYILKNANGVEAAITNFGGRIVSLCVPDKDGKLTDVVLGFDSIQAYFPEINDSDFGAAIGRYANRINQGRFTLDGTTYQLPQNNYGHCLHGGGKMGTLGWQYRVFKVEDANDSTLVLSIDSPDGDNGFPGEVKATITYTLTADNALHLDYKATTDKPTIINLTNHSYFNLSGDPTKPVTDQEMTINASNFTPVDSTFMTTGEIIPVEGTPMDFRNAKLIGADITKVDYEQIKNANGYDHNYVLDTKGDLSVEAASVYCPANGILMQVFTDQPGIQVYSGNFLNGTVTGKHNITYNQRTGICLETQHYPDTPNKADWPTAVLRPGETYATSTVYRFSTK
mgnify:CR=1 FL=1